MIRTFSAYSQRESSFELMRIIAQYMIIIYHILLVFFYNECENPDLLYKLVWIPLHIAVPCYVLVSGYFGIKFSLRGLFRIIANLFVYGLCIYLIKVFALHETHLVIRKTLFFISSTGQWFVRIYMYLYLLAPIINKMINSLSVQNRILVLILLAWISCWCGFMNFEPSLYEGKNLVHFCFLYLLGNTLSLYKEKLNQIATYKVIIAYLLVNTLSAGGGYYALLKTPQNTLLFNLFFSYNSMILILNAILFFMLFMRIKIKSGFINYIATSSLAIYMLHMFILRHCFMDIVLWIQNNVQGHLLTISAVAALAFITLFSCIVVDKLLSPCWNLASWLAKKLNQTKVGQIVANYNQIYNK